MMGSVDRNNGVRRFASMGRFPNAGYYLIEASAFAYQRSAPTSDASADRR